MRMQNGNEQKYKKLTQPVNRAASTTVDNDNIISTSVSEAVQKIPTDEKSTENAPLYVLLCIATAYKEQTNCRKKQEQLFTYQDTSSIAKKITEEILHKIYKDI